MRIHDEFLEKDHTIEEELLSSLLSYSVPFTSPLGNRRFGDLVFSVVEGKVTDIRFIRAEERDHKNCTICGGLSFIVMGDNVHSCPLQSFE